MKIPLNFYYCKGDGFHAVIEEQNEKFATEYFVYLMNELLEPEKGISEKQVTCEQVNIYNYKRHRPRPVSIPCEKHNMEFCVECFPVVSIDFRSKK